MCLQENSPERTPAAAQNILCCCCFSFGERPPLTLCGGVISMAGFVAMCTHVLVCNACVKTHPFFSLAPP